MFQYQKNAPKVGNPFGNEHTKVHHFEVEFSIKKKLLNKTKLENVILVYFRKLF